MFWILIFGKQEEIQKVHDNKGQISAAKKYIREANSGRLQENWYEKLISALENEDNGANADLCRKLKLS